MIRVHIVAQQYYYCIQCSVLHTLIYMNMVCIYIYIYMYIYLYSVLCSQNGKNIVAENTDNNTDTPCHTVSYCLLLEGIL